MKKKNLLGMLMVLSVFVTGITRAQTLRVEAESYSSVTNSTKLMKEHGDSTVGWFDELGEQLTYSIDIKTAGYYTFSIAYIGGESSFLVVKTDKEDEGRIDFVPVPYSSGNWWENPVKSWPVLKKEVLFYLAAGTQNIRIINNGVGISFDFFELTYNTNQNISVSKIVVDQNPLTIKPYRKATLVAKAYTAANEEVASKLVWSSNAPLGVYKSNALGTDKITVSLSGSSVSTDIPVKIQLPQKKYNYVVNYHGDLKTKNKGLADKNGDMASFAGMSWFWSDSSPLFWNKDAVYNMANDWNATIIRLPMSVAPGLYNDDGVKQPDTWNDLNYYKSPEVALEMMDRMIDAAIENDVYVVVDFHEHHAQNFVPEAKKFFEDIAKTYGSCDNVLFEIFNEPLKYQTGDQVRDFANQIIPIIRTYSDNVIIVGSPWWSSRPTEVNGVNDPQNNTAYTLHYYAAQHKNDYVNVMDCGRSIVITECGNDDSNYMNSYVEKAKANGISMMSWSVNNAGLDPKDPKNDNSKWSIFKDFNKNYTGPWTDSDLRSPAGFDQRKIIREWPRKASMVKLCDDNVIQKISIVAPKKSVLLNESLTMTVTGKSSCKDIPVTGITWSINAPNGVFSSSEAGQFTVKASAAGFSDSIIITVVAENATLISNSETGSKTLLGTEWFTFKNDATTITPVKDSLHLFAMEAGGANGTNNSAKIHYVLNKGSITYDPFAGLGFNMINDTLAFNLENSTGISFWHKGKNCDIKVALSSIKDFNNFSYSIPAHNDWTKVTVLWTDVKQNTLWGDIVPWDPSIIIGFRWQIADNDGTSGDIWIDEVKIEGLVFPTKYNKIIIDPVVGGTATVTTKPASASFPDSIITISVADIETGKKLKSITVKDANNTPVTVTNGTFKMPSTRPTITVTLETIPTKQSIALNTGWNMITINVSLTDNSIATITSNTGITEIKTMDAFWRKGNLEIYNSLQQIIPGEAYLVYSTTKGTLELSGNPISIPKTYPTSLKTGWNLVGYPFQVDMPINTTFGIQEVLAIKNTSGFWVPGGQLNSLTTFKPGEAYFMKK